MKVAATRAFRFLTSITHFELAPLQPPCQPVSFQPLYGLATRTMRRA
jgi:hypothetical protein